MVRAAVLRGKDPQQLLLDLEKIDQMGKYNVKVFGFKFHSNKINN